MTDAHKVMWEAEKEKSATQGLISAEMERSKQSLRKERSYSTRQLEARE